METRPLPYAFNELVLLDSAKLGLRPEDTSRSTPLALVPFREHRKVDRLRVIGWTRVHVGLWSMPRQLRLGRWQTQEDLAWGGCQLDPGANAKRHKPAGQPGGSCRLGMGPCPAGRSAG